MFQGFTTQTIDFFWGLKFNNNREWFQEHKAEYQKELNEPLRELGREIQDYFSESFPNTPMNLHICRIYRDARRLFGRGPFKEHMWFELAQERHGNDGHPVFWFEISGTKYSYGLGCYCFTQDYMDKLRKQMDLNPKTMLELSQFLSTQNHLEVVGESYKKPKPCTQEALRPWYQYKYFSIQHEQNVDETLLSRALLEDMKKAYGSMMPYYEYFHRIYQLSE